KVRSVITQALMLSRANLEEARRSVMDLRAAPLEGRSLPEAIEQLIKEWASRRKIEVDFDVEGSARPLPVRVETGLYRILQEALTNVGRHAMARHLNVQLVLLPDQVTLIIQDDGRGFDPGCIPKNHFGLIGMNERARLMCGQLAVCSTPGEGTRIEVKVPLEFLT
ncbi:MAG: sensor histidine kinase, partial [Anaerolineae bacterium]|nr:sensor histidine kinase [Anaerolineae bacterium]